MYYVVILYYTLYVVFIKYFIPRYIMPLSKTFHFCDNRSWTIELNIFGSSFDISSPNGFFWYRHLQFSLNRVYFCLPQIRLKKMYYLNIIYYLIILYKLEVVITRVMNNTDTRVLPMTGLSPCNKNNRVFKYPFS